MKQGTINRKGECGEVSKLLQKKKKKKFKSEMGQTVIFLQCMN